MHYIIRNRFGQVEGVVWNMRNAADARREYVRRGFMDKAPKGTAVRKASAKEADAAEKDK
jgi:hypothetical protein